MGFVLVVLHSSVVMLHGVGSGKVAISWIGPTEDTNKCGTNFSESLVFALFHQIFAFVFDDYQT